jgi:hypothetical protein
MVGFYSRPFKMQPRSTVVDKHVAIRDQALSFVVPVSPVMPVGEQDYFFYFFAVFAEKLGERELIGKFLSLGRHTNYVDQ